MKWKCIITAMWLVVVLVGCASQEEVSLTSQNQQETETEQQDFSETEQTDKVYVYVCGHVNTPGVYALENGSRICDALEQAGGVLEDAYAEALEQAVLVTDGQTIYVPGKDETAEASQKGEAADNKININQADVSEFMTLPGIGESKATLIIEYREEHGAFQSIEELMNIPGIKQGVFDKIKDNIKV